jgi:hypothetical protein
LAFQIGNILGCTLKGGKNAPFRQGLVDRNQRQQVAIKDSSFQAMSIRAI